MQKIGIIGAGAWGTALAQVLANAERPVTLWAREGEVVESINNDRENKLFLPGISLSEHITATESLSTAADSDMLLIVTPAQHVRPTLASLKSHLTAGKTVVICAKGIELETGYLMTQVATEILSDATIAIMTGPTFADEIANGLPSAVTVAAADKDVAEEIRNSLASRTLRPYITSDFIGAEIGSAIKNVIAIASGILMGKKLGESARAALVTRGLAEMSRLCRAMGGERETLMGMCGVGDLMLTASSMKSRNFSLGFHLGEGKTLDEILGSRNSVSEGVATAEALMVMANRHAVDMPIAEAVHKCLKGEQTVDEAIDNMLDRPLRKEAIG